MYDSKVSEIKHIHLQHVLLQNCLFYSTVYRFMRCIFCRLSVISVNWDIIIGVNFQVLFAFLAFHWDLTFHNLEIIPTENVLKYYITNVFYWQFYGISQYWRSLVKGLTFFLISSQGCCDELTAHEYQQQKVKVIDRESIDKTSQCSLSPQLHSAVSYTQLCPIQLT